MRVRDAMTRGVDGVRATARLCEAVERMSRRGVSVLFVFDERKALVGALSEGDLMRRGELGVERREPRWLESLMNGGGLAHLDARSRGRLVAEAMTRDVVSIGEDAPLAEAVELTIRRRLDRVPAMRGGAVVGVVSSVELLKRLYLTPARQSGSESGSEAEPCDRAPCASVRVSIDARAAAPAGAASARRLREDASAIGESAHGVEPPQDRLA
jgi:CBS domain-containing protein